VTSLFLRWAFARAACARGYWLVTSVYLVVVADLSPAQLVLIGIVQGITVVVAEVPAGVLADTVSRKWSLVVAHLVSGAGMVMAGLVTAFPTLVVSQALWGLGWAFASGADVAWVTDELDRPDLIDRVLAARARWELVGAAPGLLGFGLLATLTDLRTAVVASGLAMAGLGAFVAIRFPERHFTPAVAERRWHEAMSILRRGVDLARRDRDMLLVLAAWLLVNGSAEGYGRLFEKRLVLLGFGGTARPIVWFTALALVAYALGAAVLRAVEARIEGEGVAIRAYVWCCAAGVAGTIAFAQAPDVRWAIAGALVVRGVVGPVIRAVAEIWVNRRTTSDVRATVHSLLSQAENLGEIVFGFLLAAIAFSTSITAALMGAAVLLAAAGVVVSRVPPAGRTVRAHGRIRRAGGRGADVAGGGRGTAP